MRGRVLGMCHSVLIPWSDRPVSFCPRMPSWGSTFPLCWASTPLRARVTDGDGQGQGQDLERFPRKGIGPQR